MSSAVEISASFEPVSTAIGASNGDSPTRAALRARAAAAATTRNWPDSRRQRPWKYYDVSGLDLGPTTPLAETTISIQDDDGHVTRFSEASAHQSKLIDSVLGTGVSPDKDRLTAIHYAMLGDGVLVEVPANEELEAPIRLTRHVSGTGLSTPHTLIVTGANGRVTVVQEYISDGAELVALPVAEIIPGPGAEVRYYSIHSWGPRTKVFANQRFLGKERDAAFQNLHMVLGGEVVIGHLESSLEARGTSSELLGLAYGRGSVHADFYTLQDHIGPDTRSDLLYKSALRESAHAVYYGLTRIGLGARNGDANQENRNLLLSKSARADSDPVLEILTNDIIRASHGATAGPVDEEQLYYLQTRGIAKADAEALLVRAFLGQVLGRVKDETLRDELSALLDAKLEGP